MIIWYRAKVAPGVDMTRVLYFCSPVMRGPMELSPSPEAGGFILNFMWLRRELMNLL